MNPKLEVRNRSSHLRRVDRSNVSTVVIADIASLSLVQENLLRGIGNKIKIPVLTVSYSGVQ